MDFEQGLSLKKGEETRVFHLSVMTQGIAVVRGGCFQDQTGGC